MIKSFSTLFPNQQYKQKANKIHNHKHFNKKKLFKKDFSRIKIYILNYLNLENISLISALSIPLVSTISK